MNLVLKPSNLIDITVTFAIYPINCQKSVYLRMKSKITKNTELQGKFKKESPQSNGKIKSSNTSNEWITTVIFLTWYRGSN